MIRVLTEEYIPLSVDHNRVSQSDSANGRLYRRIVAAGFRGKDTVNLNRQGAYVLTADWQLLESWHPNGVSVPEFLELLAKAKSQHSNIKETTPHRGTSELAESEADSSLKGLVLQLRYRVLARNGRTLISDAKSDPEKHRFDQFNDDFMWITKGELPSLSPEGRTVDSEWSIDERIAMRLFRFHLLDAVRGLSITWRHEEVENYRMSMRITAITRERIQVELNGFARLQGLNCRRNCYPEIVRSFRPEILGALSWNRKTKKFEKFDVLAVGPYRGGSGPWTGDAPEGDFILGVSISLPATDAQQQIPPLHSEHLLKYIAADFDIEQGGGCKPSLSSPSIGRLSVFLGAGVLVGTLLTACWQVAAPSSEGWHLRLFLCLTIVAAALGSWFPFDSSNAATDSGIRQFETVLRLDRDYLVKRDAWRALISLPIAAVVGWMWILRQKDTTKVLFGRSVLLCLLLVILIEFGSVWFRGAGPGVSSLVLRSATMIALLVIFRLSRSIRLSGPSQLAEAGS